MPNNKKMRSLGIVLAIVLALTGFYSPTSAADSVASSVGVSFAAANNDGSSAWPSGCVAADSSTPGNGYTAPAPCKVDASGTNQDRYYIAEADFLHPVYGWGNYYLNGEGLGSGFSKLKPGTTSIVITTSLDSGSWTFKFTDDNLGKEARNTYWVKVSDTCKTEVHSTTRYRETMAYAKNGEDKTKLTFSVYPQVFDVRGIVSVVDTVGASNILDGDTAAIRIMELEGRVLGLRPGQYLVKFWHSYSSFADSNKDRIVKQMRLTVPKCSKASSVHPGSKQARGTLKRVGCHRVKVVADARGFTAAPRANYRLVKRPLGMKARQNQFAVMAGHKRSLMVKKPGQEKATVILKVKRTNGTWKQLDRVKLPRCR